MHPSVLVGWHNVEMFSIMRADFGGLYPVLPLLWDEYECPYIFFVPTPLAFLYCCSLFLHSSSNDILV